LYVPLADLRRFGIPEAEFLRLVGTRSSEPAAAERADGAPRDARGSTVAGAPAERDPVGKLDDLVRFEAARARRFLTSGMHLLPLLEPRERFCPRMLAAIYGEVLTRIERMGGAALAARVSLSGPRKLRLAAEAFVEARRGSRRCDRRLARNEPG
jgi:hypothetical protein